VDLGLVRAANEQVSITYVCALIGMSLPDHVNDTHSVKVRCPFGPIWHADRGAEPSFRVYPGSNSAYCFAGCGFYTPVWLYAQARDLHSEESARDLLERVGYRAPDVEREWERVTASQTKVSEHGLIEALKVYCARVIPEWETVQLDPSVAATFARCLALLPRVRSVADGQEWLRVCKQVMSSALEARGA
jgi:hypothetical protein